MSETLIHMQNLTRDFTVVGGSRASGTDQAKTIRAVDHLNLDIPTGIVFGFLGPNGSGKTTTIRLLLGLLEPTTGQAQVFDFDTRTQPEAIRERTGALLEHTGLYERLSAADNLDFWGRVYHLSPAERRARSQELLENMGLWERRAEVVGGWSRGMKQKLAVARTLLHRPKLIFLDEPTSGLDPVAAAALREDLARLVQEQKVTVFLTTHNLTDAERLCEQVAVIRNGRLLAVGAPDQLRARTGKSQVEIYGRGFTPELIDRVRAMPGVSSLKAQNNHLLLEMVEGADTAPVVSALIQQGAEIEEVRKNKASLEDIFLELVEDEPSLPDGQKVASNVSKWS